jgi:hypothetical protein
MQTDILQYDSEPHLCANCQRSIVPIKCVHPGCQGCLGLNLWLRLGWVVRLYTPGVSTHITRGQVPEGYQRGTASSSSSSNKRVQEEQTAAAAARDNGIQYTPGVSAHITGRQVPEGYQGGTEGQQQQREGGREATWTNSGYSNARQHLVLHPCLQEKLYALQNIPTC